VQAFVLIQTENGTPPIAASLRSIPGVESSDDLTGAFDAIALATAETVQDLFDRVLTAIRSLPGVVRALPAPLVRARSGLTPVPAAA
jgi:Lrp/AsnC ligand binding domain